MLAAKEEPYVLAPGEKVGILSVFAQIWKVGSFH
jgi:hypothetical protein